MVFDTNILVYAADRRSPFGATCRSVLDRARRGPVPAFLSWSVCYEFLRVASHPRIFRKPWSGPEGWRFLERLLASPGFAPLGPTPRHARVLEQTLSEMPELRGRFMHDVHIAVLMREYGLRRICTHDAGFRRFPFLTVVDPLGNPGGAASLDRS